MHSSNCYRLHICLLIVTPLVAHCVVVSPPQTTLHMDTWWRRSVVVSGVGLINEVNRHWARLVLGWVAACGRVNHLSM